MYFTICCILKWVDCFFIFFLYFWTSQEKRLPLLPLFLHVLTNTRVKLEKKLVNFVSLIINKNGS